MTEETVLFAGTTEGRRLSELLAQAGIAHTVCVATAYGEIVLKPHPLVHVRQGRMNQAEIADFLREGGFTLAIDATHPFAEEVTSNIKAAIKACRGAEREIAYLRLRRDAGRREESGVAYFETNEACARALADTTGNILLTTGSKELSRYCENEAVKARLYVRVLPGMESLALCMEQGVRGKRIIAMQGPFTAELNEAIIRQYRIAYVVTKESGASGGYPEKLEAARKTGAKVFVIGCPREEEGASFAQVCDALEKRIGRPLGQNAPMEIVLAGVGMGREDGLTKAVEAAVREADILLGAERMLAGIASGQEKHPFYQAGQIIPYLRDVQETNGFAHPRKVVILFSGDSGFYSGCKSLYAALEKEIKENRLAASLHVLSGVSAVSYLAACVGESYHDAAVYSIHGKALCNLAGRIRKNEKTFLLTSGVRDVNYIGEALLAAGMPECEIIAGCQLSYPEQRIMRLSPAACVEMKEEGLYTCLIKNPCADRRRLTHGIADERFIRSASPHGNVPMTKEEVREVSICKLRLREGAVVYDIGSGTGSVAVEIAGLSDDIQVYAVEQKQEAAALIEQNKEKFGLENIRVVNAAAPECLSGLPTPTQVFIGGSNGRLEEIVSALRRKSKSVRIVVNAVSVETLCEIRRILSMYRIKEEEIVQLQVSRARRAGSHHLMQAGNPVWICAFEFDGMGTKA